MGELSLCYPANVELQNLETNVNDMKFSVTPRSADNFDERLVREAVWAAVEIFGLQRAALCLIGPTEFEEEVAKAA